MPVPALSSVVLFCAPLKSVDGQSAGGESDKESADAPGIVPDVPEKGKEGSPLDLEGEEAEGQGEEAVALLALQMVLVPPADAPMVIIQSVVRGLIALRRYRLMKVSSDPRAPRSEKKEIQSRVFPDSLGSRDIDTLKRDTPPIRRRFFSWMYAYPTRFVELALSS